MANQNQFGMIETHVRATPVTGEVSRTRNAFWRAGFFKRVIRREVRFAQFGGVITGCGQRTGESFFADSRVQINAVVMHLMSAR